MRNLRLAGFLFSTILALTAVAGCSPKSQTPPHTPDPSGIPNQLPIATTSGRPEATAPRIEIAGDSTPSLVRLDKDQEVVVRVRLHGLPLITKKRPPLDLALVLDTSGSMEGQPIEQAREACAKLIDLLADGDSLAIVTFGSHANVIIPSVRLNKDTREASKRALKAVKAEGTTDMAGGLNTGLGQLRPHIQSMPDGIHRIVLVGDGVPNDAPTVLTLADSARTEHVPVTTLGLGNDFDETLMTALAQRSAGTYHFVDDAARVATVFKEQISRLDRLVARNARIELTPGPGVTITEVVGIPFAPSGNGRVQVATIGDLAEGQTRDLFVRVMAKGRHDGKTTELIDAQVSYTLPEGGAELTANAFMKIEGSSNAARLKDAAVVDIEHGLATIRVADGIVKAIALAREGELNEARKLLDASMKIAKDGEKKFSDKALGEKVAEMVKLRKTLPSLAPPPEQMESNNGGAGMDRSPSAAKMAAKPSRPAVAPASPEDALELRATHGEAMKSLQ